MNTIRTKRNDFPVLSTLALCVAGVFCTQQAFSVEPFANFGESQSGIDWSTLPASEQLLTDKPLTITEAGTYVLSGQSNASILVNSEGRVRLVLDGVKVSAKEGAAIVVENAKDTVIHLAGGSENYLEDSAIRADDNIDGAIYSADDLFFEGSGSLTVQANFADGIVSNDDMTFFSGTYLVRSVDDGIRGKDSLVIKGGEISVVADDDGIKSTNDSDTEKGFVHVYAGTINVDAEDDAVKAVNSIVVDGGEINVTRSLEGLEATNISLNGGELKIVAADDGINAVRIGSNSDVFIAVNGGNIDVTVGAGDTDAFDSNGSITVAGGTINITAPTSAFDADRGAEMTGGTLIVNGETLDSIPASRRGRGRGDRGGGFWERDFSR